MTSKTASTASISTSRHAPGPVLSRRQIFDAARFEEQLARTSNIQQLFSATLKHGREHLRAAHYKGASARRIVHTHSWLVDQILLHAWTHHAHLYVQQGAVAPALIAVGGYGRGELHPASDIDLLVLLPQESGYDAFIETFLRFLWDIGLEVGHSSRTVEQCVQAAREDITVATNLMETRLLAGDADLLNTMRKATAAPAIWPSAEFFAAKYREQQKRHHQYDDSGYNLEPNVKEGPGGLRDIQMIMWVAQRHFGDSELAGLVEHGLLTDQEYRTLNKGRTLLWRIRNALHYLAGRREDRLLFDHQRILAKEFGFHDRKGSLAVEQFMKQYYRTIKQLSLLNEILLQYFQETLLSAEIPDIQEINARFHSRNGYLAANNDRVFERRRSAILEMFLILQQHPELKGVRAHTIRLLLSGLGQVNNAFRNDIRNQSLFMEIIRQPRGITHELRRMNAYGVLGAYIPAFGRIVGQMQHDLFHVYTVDEHTLFVVRNLRRFTVPEFANEFPLASSIIRQLVKPERLYLAGLFHDIAKGRGGDHSELGEYDARRFCRKHGLSDYDTRFVCWLVRNHLLMSWTAQRQDISDPGIVLEFARKIGNQEHLDNLYLLTVADIRGTSPRVWNDWKGHLLMQLYRATSRVFLEGADAISDVADHVRSRRQAALDVIRPDKLLRERIERYWSQMTDYYFLHYDTDSLAWHAQTISSHSAADFPLVATRFNPDIGGSEFLVYLPTRSDLFVQLTGAFDRLNLSILDARVHSTFTGFALDTFVVMDQSGEPVVDEQSLRYLEQTLRDELTQHRVRPGQAMHVPRRLKHFPIKTQVHFGEMRNGLTSIMEVVAQDRPGLLYQVALALHECGAKLAAAKISTLGERVEDVFYITNRDNEPVRDTAQQQCLRDNLMQRLQPHRNDQTH